MDMDTFSIPRCPGWKERDCDSPARTLWLSPECSCLAQQRVRLLAKAEPGEFMDSAQAPNDPARTILVQELAGPCLADPDAKR